MHVLSVAVPLHADEPDGSAEGGRERLGEPVGDEATLHGPPEEVGGDGRAEPVDRPFHHGAVGERAAEPLGRGIVVGHDTEEAAEVGGVEQRARVIDQVEPAVRGDPTRGEVRLTRMRKA